MKLRRRNASFPWSDKEDAVLRDALVRGESTSMVGKLLGRTEEAVRQRAVKLKISAAKAVPTTGRKSPE